MGVEWHYSEYRTQETGLYYLQSRYYNPEWGRFINADSAVSTGQGFNGNNMFAYCLNNPVNGCDPCGTCFHNWSFENCEKCQAALNSFVTTVSNAWDAAITWCEDAYNTYNNAYQQQTKLQNEITRQQAQMLQQSVEKIIDVNAHTRQLEMQIQHIQTVSACNFMRDRFSTPENAAESLGVIAFGLEAVSKACKSAGCLGAAATFEILAWLCAGTAAIVACFD